MDSGQQASSIFTIILSFLNIAYTLLEQPIFLIKAASACILEGLHTDLYQLYTKHLLRSKKNSCLLSHILLTPYITDLGFPKTLKNSVQSLTE